MDYKKSLLDFRNFHGLSLQELSGLLYPESNERAMVAKLKAYENGSTKLPKHLTWALSGLDVYLKDKKRSTSAKKNKFTFIDLFAGIGGIRQAFDSVGGRCVFTSEWDKYASLVYEANFHEKPSGDITKIAAEEIPRHDILLAGFPCQPFSIAGVSKKQSLGRKHGFEDKTQGTLFFDIARIIKHHQPKMFLLENVKNLMSHDKKQTFQVIKEILTKDLGYNISYKIVDAKLLLPQHRERIYIIGTRAGQAFEFPKIDDEQKKLSDILMDNSEVDNKYTLSDKLWESLQRHAAKHKAKGNGFGFGLVGAGDVARTLSARYYKDGSEILIKQKGKNPRRLTPRECARLMGFSEDFKIPVSDTQAYKCFGNSVAVPVVKKLAQQISKDLERNFKKEKMEYNEVFAGI